MQRERRQNPYPWTWEVPSALFCLVALVLALGVHLGSALAQLARGQRWTWPDPAHVFISIPTVLATAEQLGVLPWVVTTEILLLFTLSAGISIAWGRWGLSSIRGLATRDQAEQLLGLTRLQKVASIARPDLYPTRHTRGFGR